MKTDAEWKELYDNASASEYYEERWKDASAQLTAAEEQLAEMREVLEGTAKFLRRQKAPRAWGVVQRIDKALSAAPKRGWEGTVYVDPEFFTGKAE